MKDTLIRETQFYIPMGCWRMCYAITNGDIERYAFIDRQYIINIQSRTISINYRLRFNVLKIIDNGFKKRIIQYFDNLVNVLTHDCQTIFTDDLDDRMFNPLLGDELHVEILES